MPGPVFPNADAARHVRQCRLPCLAYARYFASFSIPVSIAAARPLPLHGRL